MWKHETFAMLGEKQTGRLAGWLDGGDGCMNGQTDRQSYYFCSRLFSMQPNGAWHRVPAAKYLSTDCGFCYVVHFFLFLLGMRIL